MLAHGIDHARNAGSGGLGDHTPAMRSGDAAQKVRKNLVARDGKPLVNVGDGPASVETAGIPDLNSVLIDIHSNCLTLSVRGVVAVHYCVCDGLPQNIFWNFENIFSQRSLRNSSVAQIPRYCGHGILHHERNRAVAHLSIEESHAGVLGLLRARVDRYINHQPWELLLRIGC